MLYDGRATDVVSTRPDCDICDDDGPKDPAAVDAATYRGSWAYMCTEHHRLLGGSRLGTGVGQVLLCGDDYDEELKEHYDLEEPDAV